MMRSGTFLMVFASIWVVSIAMPLLLLMMPLAIH